MLFYSSSEFPEEDYFRTFITEHGGDTNAYTDKEETNFYFSIEKDYFKHALKVFSRFFIDPIFSQDQVQREIFAVNSEHEKNMLADNWRLNRCIEIMANPEHPFHHFASGNN
mmetsp:Transcript_30684/g.5537  ORF Transcript_30684/g.5537 Transcript_30684/m.5537 type:complete len:112 (-) Transcript_30684:2173-2508(-)